MTRFNKQHLDDHGFINPKGWWPQDGEDLTERATKNAQEGGENALKTGLLLHLGAFHGWRAEHGGNIGLTPLLASHDLDHHAEDLLKVEQHLSDRVRAAIDSERKRIAAAIKADIKNAANKSAKKATSL